MDAALNACQPAAWTDRLADLSVRSYLQLPNHPTAQQPKCAPASTVVSVTQVDVLLPDGYCILSIPLQRGALQAHTYTSVIV